MRPDLLMRPPFDSPERTPADDLQCLDFARRSALIASDSARRDFRDALGSFATGVTVLTTLTASGEPIGVTISSFNSVSLDPPLILWSLANDSPRLAVFRRASYYAVNILAVSQQGVSDTFASRDGDRFGAVAFRKGLAGVPLIEGCAAWFECSNEVQYPGGDHLVFIGRVERYARREGEEPLLFHAGRYRKLHGDSAG